MQQVETTFIEFGCITNNFYWENGNVDMAYAHRKLLLNAPQHIAQYGFTGTI